MKRTIVSDGTSLYFAKGNALNKVNLTTGVATPLSTDKVYKALTYGNSVLYGADQDGLYSIHATTGVATPIIDMQGIEGIAYYDTDTLVILTGNSLVLMVIAADTAAGTVALDGDAVDVVTITDGGMYTTAPTVTFSGDGTLATGTAVLNDAGEVASVTVDAGGADYTGATIAFSAGAAAGSINYLNHNM